MIVWDFNTWNYGRRSARRLASQLRL